MSRMPIVALRRKLAVVLVVGLAARAASGAAPSDLAVVVSIKPLHSLVAGVMQGAGQPSLLVKGAASPHSYSLRPSDARGLETADVVFWLGEGMEAFLARPLAALPQRARIVELDDAPGLVLLRARAGGVWEAHHDGSDEAAAPADRGEQAHGRYDGHLWLDPRNARRLVARIAEALGDADPARAALYSANAAALDRRLQELDWELEAALAPVKAVPFIVLHDAYRYLEARYGLAGVGSITVTPEQPPGARRLGEIRRKLTDRQARCVFREPNVAPGLVDNMVAGTGARTGTLDPEGVTLPEGPELYFTLMRNLAQALTACLQAAE